MRLLSVPLAICLSLSCSDGSAQSSSNGDRPLARSPLRFVPSDIDQGIVKQLNGAWQQCVLGTRDTEAVVLVLRNPDGSIRAVSAGRSNKAYEFTFVWNPAIIAVFHTHPNNRTPEPVKQDILLARRFDVPIFTLSGRGMFMYDPTSDRTTKIKNGVEWLNAASWLTKQQLAVKERSKR